MEQNIRVPEHGSVIFPCYRPDKTDVVWFLSNNVTSYRRVFYIDRVDDVFMNRVNASLFGDFANLTFSNLTRNDTGTYTCKEILKSVIRSIINVLVVGE